MVSIWGVGMLFQNADVKGSYNPNFWIYVKQRLIQSGTSKSKLHTVSERKGEIWISDPRSKPAPMNLVLGWIQNWKRACFPDRGQSSGGVNWFNSLILWIWFTSASDLAPGSDVALMGILGDHLILWNFYNFGLKSWKNTLGDFGAIKSEPKLNSWFSLPRKVWTLS